MSIKIFLGKILFKVMVSFNSKFCCSKLKVRDNLQLSRHSLARD